MDINQYITTSIWKLTWIPLQLSLDKIIGERAKLLNSTDGNITAIYFFPLFVKLIVNLQFSG